MLYWEMGVTQSRWNRFLFYCWIYSCKSNSNYLAKQRKRSIGHLFKQRKVFYIVGIGKLYHLLWNLEENYKKLKISSEIENFCGFTLEAVLQEFWSHLVMNNILTTFILDHEVPYFYTANHKFLFMDNDGVYNLWFLY